MHKTIALAIIVTANAGAANAASPSSTPPYTANALRSDAAVLEEGAAFYEEVHKQHVNCDGGITWHGKTVAVTTMSRRVYPVWQHGDHVENALRDWAWKVLEFYGQDVNSCGSMGDLRPVNWGGYGNNCNDGLYDVAIAAHRDDAAVMRRTAAIVDCVQGRLGGLDAERAQRERVEKNASDAARRAQADAEQERLRGEQEQQRREQQDEADQIATERAAEEQAAEEERQREVAERTEANQRAQEELVAAGVATGMGLMASADTNDSEERPSNQFELAAGLAVPSIHDDAGCGQLDASCYGAGAAVNLAYRHRWWRSRDFKQPQRGVELGFRAGIVAAIGTPSTITGNAASLLFIRAETWTEYWRGPFALGVYGNLQRISGTDDEGGHTGALKLLAGPMVAIGGSRFDFVRASFRWLLVGGGAGSFSAAAEMGPLGMYASIFVEKTTFTPAGFGPVSEKQFAITGGRRFRW